MVSDLKLKDFPVENEPILGYRKGSNERKELEKELEKARNEVKDVPIMIAGEEIRTKDVRYQVSQLSLLFSIIDLFSLCPDEENEKRKLLVFNKKLKLWLFWKGFLDFKVNFFVNHSDQGIWTFLVSQGHVS